MPHRRHTSTSSAIVAAVFAVQAVADTVTLTQFQRITGFPEACTQAYETPISGCTTSDFKNGNACSRACVAGLEKETTLLNTACLGISTSSSTLIGLFFEEKGVQALCPRIATDGTTTSTTSSTSPAAAASSSTSQSESTSSSSSSSSISSTPTTTSSTSTTSEASSSSSSSASASSTSTSESSSSSTTSSSSATAQATTFSSTTISQTSFNIPLTSATTSAANTANTAFGGDIGNLNGPPNKGSSLRIDSIFMSMAAGLAASFLIWG